MIKNCPISVLMPVYNAGPFLNKAIESILKQTYANFEFIIIDDGSTDNTEAIVLSYTDSRIKYYKNTANLGIVATLNKGIDLSQGKYLARMDADDISLPERFEKQYQFMEKYPEIAVCGSQAICIDKKGNETGKIDTVVKSIKESLFFYNTFIHPTTFFKTEVIKKYKYHPDYQFAEDYYILAQIAANYEIGNIGEPLLLYRIHNSNTTSTKITEMKQSHIKVIEYQMTRLLEVKVHYDSFEYLYSLSKNDFKAYDLPIFQNLLNSLLDGNKKKEIYNYRLFHKILHFYWYNVMISSGKKDALFTFFNSPLLCWHALTFKQFRRMLKTSIKSLFH